MRALMLVMVIAGPIPRPALAQGLAQTYLCTGDASTGFQMNEKTKEWESTRFKADARHVVRKKDAKWEMSTMGSTVVYPCTISLSAVFIECGPIIKFIMSTETMRYQKTSVLFSTIISPSEPLSGDSSYIEIGRCTPI
jgi:hypothetical protein